MIPPPLASPNPALQFAVQAHDLVKVFDRAGRKRLTDPVTAVDGVSFALPAGRTLAVVGESGSGKTTLARLCMALERPTSGSISFSGRVQPARLSTRERRRHAREIQMVFQNPYRSLDPRQRVGDTIDELLRLHFDLDAKARADRTEELFELVRLDPHHLQAFPAELSGGQRQRVCIARALATDPRVIILDEAVAALDMLVQAQVLNLLLDLQDSTGVSYLFVTHDLAVVRQVGDDVIVMQSGRVVEHGTVDAVLDNPEHPYTRRLLDSVPRTGWTPTRRTVG